MNKEQKDIINQLVDYNSQQYNFLKCAEELQELSLELIKTATKPNMDEDRHQAIVDEIGDVEIRFKVLKKYFKKEDIQERIDYKVNKFEHLLQTKEYELI